MTKFLEIYDRHQADSRFVPRSQMDNFVAGLMVAGTATSEATLELLYGDRPVKTTVVTTTPRTGVLTLPPQAVIRKVTYSAPARFRLYRTAAGRTFDLPRPFSAAYLGGAGMLYEYLATAPGEIDLERPFLIASAGATSYYWSADADAAVTIEWSV